MTVTRDYTWRLTPESDEDLADLSRRAHKVLAWACEGEKRLTCKGITGEALGVVELAFTIVGRDLWAAGQISQDLINHVTWRLKNPAQVTMTSLGQAPHEHRGYAHGRQKRVNRPRSQERTDRQPQD